jgi:hypothetical protein
MNCAALLRGLEAEQHRMSRGDTNDTKSFARDISTIPMRFRLAGVTG